MPDGYYTLTAKVKKSNGFIALEMFAESNDNRLAYNISEENAAWKIINISRIPVKKGKAEIGFLATGSAGSFCYVDDITLLKEQ